MPHSKRYMEALLFGDQIPTTSLRDFRYGDIKGNVETVYKEKQACLRIRPPSLKYLHTMEEWKSPIVPMSLYFKPKEIVRTNPWKVQQPYERPEDAEKIQVRKTRPRLVMTPAVSMDDIENEKDRQILLENVYTATATKGMKDSAAYFPTNNVEAPCPGIPAVAHPVGLPKLTPSYVSPEWRMDSASWDTKGLRTHCLPTKQFWLDKRLPRCRACNEYATIKAYRTNRRLMKSSNRN